MFVFKENFSHFKNLRLWLKIRLKNLIEFLEDNYYFMQPLPQQQKMFFSLNDAESAFSIVLTMSKTVPIQA